LTATLVTVPLVKSVTVADVAPLVVHEIVVLAPAQTVEGEADSPVMVGG
jgi:hypothetical protein